MRVLITGGTGYLGSALAVELRQHGHEVVAWGSGASGGVDVRDRVAVASGLGAAGPLDAVCHLAALPRARDSLSDPMAYYDVNLNGTLAVLAALDRRAGGGGSRRPRLVYTSTGAVYGGASGRLSESAVHDHPPVTPYGRSKLAAEWAIAAQAATGRLAAVSLRCFNIAGASAAAGWMPDRDPTRLIPRALAVAAAGSPGAAGPASPGRAEPVALPMNGDGSAVREYTHVADVASAVRLALELGTVDGGHRTYNVGSGVGTSNAEVVESVRRVTGRKVPVEHRPPVAEPQVLMADSSRIRAELGWTPRRSSIDAIVADAWSAVAPS